VTYFVRGIGPFVETLATSSRRRVIIDVISIPPPNQFAEFFRLVYGEGQAPLPGHVELLPVLWELGILPDVRVLPEPRDVFPSREAALERALTGTWLSSSTARLKASTLASRRLRAEGAAVAPSSTSRMSRRSSRSASLRPPRTVAVAIWRLPLVGFVPSV